MKAVKYVIVFLIAVQFLFSYAFNLPDVYHNRMNYTLMLDNSNMHDIDAVLEQVKRDIDKNDRKDYLVILGDSILYGSPGNSDQPVNVFLQQKPGAPVIYNLSFPAMQIGDFYTMLLKLDKFGIEADKLLFNIRYASFIPRDPNPRAVFWLGNDLRKLDRETYLHVLPQLEASDFETPSNPYEYFQRALHEDWLPQLSLMRYKDYFRYNLHNWWLTTVRHQELPDDALDDSRAWHIKKAWQESIGLNFDDLLSDPQLVASFTDVPFDLSENNWDVYFLNKILALREGKQTWVILSGTNHDLMKDSVSKPGYAANLKAIDKMMAGKAVTYVNLEGVIPGDYFSDHTHMTPEGNAMLADILWPHIKP
ncbi:hypothetical protein [Paenibacillus ginsengarvi]|uniref:Uncharacterized protein n=1 Tax=Paenibacillus ginsengarvi TaxID=400777 RepID=A0A3B0BM72_9BACL|nr:hypothetical protein [Paenibacillus ginsengarvi]RKN74190.1 hypothetical protein D7M11_27465 [Paenibacillus ginsengarvi]